MEKEESAEGNRFDTAMEEENEVEDQEEKRDKFRRERDEERTDDSPDARRYSANRRQETWDEYGRLVLRDSGSSQPRDRESHRRTSFPPEMTPNTNRSEDLVRNRDYFNRGPPTRRYEER
jgi:hypothetical protein